MRNVINAARFGRLPLLIIGLASGCSGFSGPSTGDLKNRIAQDVPGLSIEDIKCESYEDKSQEGVGRSSCSGTLSLDQDLYAPISNDDVTKLLVSAGIPPTGTNFFYGRHLHSIYTKVSPSGVQAPFSSDCSYQREVDSWNVGCSTNYQAFSGQSLAQIGENPIIEDTPSYDAWIGEVTADFKQLDQAYGALEAKINSFFAPGKTIVLRDKQSGQPWARSKMTSGLSWQGEPDVLGHQSSFYVVTKYQDLRERKSSTFCGYPKGEPADDLLISGEIEPSSDAAQGPFIAHVALTDRNAMFQNKFMGCGGGGMPFNGSTWGTGENNALELISN